MATTARELLALAREEARQAEQPTVEQAEAAITALGVAARELQRRAIADTCGGGDRERWIAVNQLIAACDAATAAWPARPGRLPDLVGAACDALGTHTAELGENARWALAVELSRACRHCAAAALRHGPYARVPPLRWVHAAAVEVERQAARRPPEPGSGIVLDLPVPSPHPVTAPHHAAVLNAAGTLGRALRRECVPGPLSIRAALATVAAAEDAARRCAGFASTHSRTSVGAWRHAPDSWQIIYAALVRFQDGSRRRHAEPSATVQAALGVEQALARIGSDHDMDAEAATALRTVANQLPLLARELDLAARRWGRDEVLYARARDLLRTDELVPAILNDATVPATAEHLSPIITAVHVTERLSAALSAELNQTAGRLGHQPQPHLVASHERQARDRQLHADAAWAARLSVRVPDIASPASLLI